MVEEKGQKSSSTAVPPFVVRSVWYQYEATRLKWI